MKRRHNETAAANYSYLRGLLFIPAGPVGVAAALGNWGAGPLRHSWVFLPAALVIGLASVLIARFYNEHYGRLSPSTRQQVRAALALTIGVLVMIGGSLLLRSR